MKKILLMLTLCLVADFACALPRKMFPNAMNIKKLVKRQGDDLFKQRKTINFLHSKLQKQKNSIKKEKDNCETTTAVGYVVTTSLVVGVVGGAAYVFDQLNPFKHM